MPPRGTPLLQITFISLICVGIYCGLRALPNSQCSFLHYEITEVTADGFEFCKGDSAVFLDLTQLKFPTTLELDGEGTVALNKTTPFVARILMNGTKPMRPYEIAVTHTQKVHLLIIDPGLEDYQHLHPKPDGVNGDWLFEFMPKSAGRYMVFAELVPAKTKRRVIAQSFIDVPGRPTKPHFKPNNTIEQGGIQYTFSLLPERPKTWSNTRVQLRINRATGDNSIRLQPIMGAYAHMVAFKPHCLGYAHIHPLPTGKESDSVPQLEFLFNTGIAGAYRLWTQVMINDKEHFIPFDIEVQES